MGIFKVKYDWAYNQYSKACDYAGAFEKRARDAEREIRQMLKNIER